MEKRGSRYLRWALINAAKYVCNWEPTFTAYLEKKRSEGKHYYVALSHAAKKLVRLLYHLETTGEKYIPQTLSWARANKYILYQPAQRTLDKPKHSDATIFLQGRFPALLSCSLRRPRCLFSASVCCLSRAAHFLHNLLLGAWHLIVSLLFFSRKVYGYVRL